jgi:hypothetical protein
MKFAFPRGFKLTVDQNMELGNLIKKIHFFDVIDGRNKTFDLFMQTNVILTIFTSTCIGCQEDNRLNLLNELALSKNSDRNKIVYLFGIGNNPDSIKQKALLNGWDRSPFIVGVITDSDIDQKDDDYKLFSLNVDPRTFIIKKGEITFSENLENSSSINLNFLSKKR